MEPLPWGFLGRRKSDAYRGVHTRIVYASLNGVVQREAA